MDIEMWLASNSFHCPTLHARISPAQCQANRSGRRAMGHDGVGALEGCLKCQHWQNWQQLAGMNPLRGPLPLFGGAAVLPESLPEMLPERLVEPLLEVCL